MVGVHLEGDVPSPVGLLLDLCGRHFAQPLAEQALRKSKCVEEEVGSVQASLGERGCQRCHCAAEHGPR